MHSPQEHQQLPCAPDAEDAILSSFFLAPNQVGELLIAKGIMAEYFHRPQSRIAFDSMMEIWMESDSLEPISVINLLRDRNIIEQVGAEYIVGLYGFLPTASNAQYYLEILREKFVLREIIRVTGMIQNAAYFDQEDVWQTLAKLQSEANRIGIANETESHIKNAILAIEDEERACVMGDPVGISSGLTQLDNMLPAKNGRMLVMAGRPGCGKTAICEQALCHQVRSGIAALYIQIDTPVKDFITRLICRHAGLIFDDFDKHRLDAFQVAAFSDARRIVQSLLKDRLRIPPPSRMTPEQIRTLIRHEIRKSKIQIVYIDVFGQIQGRGKTMVERYADVSMELRSMAREFDIPIVIIAHLASGSKDEAWKEPVEIEIAWCSQLIKDADNAVIVWSDQNPATLRDDKTGQLRRQRVYLKSGKGRGCGIGDETLWFDMPRMTFYAREK